MAKKKKHKMREYVADSGESSKARESSLQDSQRADMLLRGDSIAPTSSLRDFGKRQNRGNLPIRNEKKGKRGFRRIYNAFFYSLHGLKAAFCEEEAFRQILIVSVILIPLGAYLGESFAEKVLLILPCVLAIIAELTNSAIENAIDFAGLEIHPFAKKAKDMGSAIQLVACAFMAFVWIYYLILILL